VVRRPLEQFVECGHESTDYMTTCLDPAKFQRPLTTAEGEDCALVVPRDLSVTRKDVRRLKRMSCPATAPFDPRFLVRLERRFLVPA